VATDIIAARFFLGSARGSRVGFGGSPKQSFVSGKFAKAGRFRQHASRVRSPETLRRLIAGLLIFLCLRCNAAETIPPKPAGYFNDYAGVISKDAAQRFNEQLAQFERDTSNQVVVAVYPKMQSDSSIEDYTQRVAQSWGVGQKDQRNGAVLFVFVQDRKMYIQVGYGLEGALPDVTAFDITEYEIKPHFRANDYEGGLAAGIDSICKAIRGEYKGTGTTVRERHTQRNTGTGGFVFLIIFIIVMILIARGRRRRGYRYSGFGGPFIGGWSGGSGGGWSSGGGGGFSGFSGGGGSFGGGGAGSSW
jgi:uncharacterized protein